MKATLEFDLSDPDQNMEHLRCVKSLDMAITLWEFKEYLRSKIKYASDETTEKELLALESAQEDYLDMLQDRGIILDDLIG